MATATYVCTSCRNEQKRAFSVPYFISKCETGGGFVRKFRESIVEKAIRTPTDLRPDDWDSLDTGEKVDVAMEANVITKAELV